MTKRWSSTVSDLTKTKTRASKEERLSGYEKIAEGLREALEIARASNKSDEN